MTVNTTLPDTRVKNSGPRAERFAAQAVLWEFSSVKRVRNCSRFVANDAAGFGIRVTENPDGTKTGGFSGLKRCGSVWACPTCNAKIARARAEELAIAVAIWKRRGGRVALVTLTMRHYHSDDIGHLWDGVSAAWAAVTSGNSWLADQNAYGSSNVWDSDVAIAKGEGWTRASKIPWVRAVELTYGKNGWHVHVHAALFLKGVTTKGLRALCNRMYGRWSDQIQRCGFDMPLRDSGGLDFRFTKDVSEITYLSKVGYEIVGGLGKSAKKGSRTPFGILASFVATGDMADLMLWRDYEKASVGRRQITWSRNFRKWLLASEETQDQEIVDEDTGGENVVTLGQDSLTDMLPYRAAVLHAVETLPLELLRSCHWWQWLELIPENCQ